MKIRWMVAAGAATVLLVGGVWLIASPQSPSDQSPRPSSPLAQATPPSAAAKRAQAAPTIGAPTARPTIITVNVPTTVTVTVQINPAPLSGGVNLLRLGATGTQPAILGVMHDDGRNGDALANDGVYTLAVNFNETLAGQIQLEVSVAFKGLLRRTPSAVTTVSVYNMHTDSAIGISVEFPTDLYLVPPPSGASQQFLLQSTPQFIGVGEAFDDPDPSTEPSDGYVISISSSQYTTQPFDINTWIAAILPNYDVNTITQSTVEGRPAYSITFDDANAPKPLVVIPRGTTVYEVSYNSTFDPGTPQEGLGLAHFNDVLQHLQFLN